MSYSLLEFQTKFRLTDLTIYELDYWVWSVRPKQVTLGSGVLSLKRLEPAFSGLTQAESADLGVIIKAIEHALPDAWHYDKVNYLMLMMKDSHVHFHIIPRYAERREFASKEWVDQTWPSIAGMSLVGEPEADEVLFAIRDKLKGYVKSAHEDLLR